MQIEIVTTKKKLSLSIVKQMPQLPEHIVAMQRCEVLGYIKHPSLGKGVQHVLAQYNEEYYVLPLRKWRAIGNEPTLTDSTMRYGRKFPNHEHRNEWLELFELIKTKALATHIYL